MKLAEVTNGIRAQREKALVAFLTAGFPDEPSFRRLVHAADAAGCDLIEIGIPFSDPVADGPLIQESSQRALEMGMCLSRALDIAGELTQEIATPLVVMSYYNPILRMGCEAFATRAASAGVIGAIVPDVPFEESEPVRPILQASDVTLIDLVAPTSDEERIGVVAGQAEGFLYLVSVTGVTGVRAPVVSDVSALARRVRAVTATPVYAGFGIADPETARAAAECCDGVIIGSALIRQTKQASSADEAVDRVYDFLARTRSAIGAGRPSERETK